MINAKKVICMTLSLFCLHLTVTANITLNLKNVTVKNAMEILKKEYGYSFVFESDDIDTKKIISVSLQNKSIDETARQILQNQDVSYEIMNKNIVIQKKSPAPAPQQNQPQREIKGKITDPEGEPVIGANIIEKGTSNGTVSDVNGNYNILIKDGGVLQYSYLGMKTVSMSVGDLKEINIVLEYDQQLVGEVVIVGYGKQSKRNVTGAISSIQSENIARSTSNNVSEALSGKIQGISTRAGDARPGLGSNLQIRNMSDPLFVIDGIPYGGITGTTVFGLTQGSGADIFNSLSLDDIESISILKDASAAIYGLRASNGVVLVTTKKGKKNEKVQVNVNGYYGIQNFTRFPELANARQYVRALVESEQNYNRDPNLLYTWEELSKWENGSEPGYKGYNYREILTRSNVPQYYVNANVVGGTERSNYYLSLGQIEQEAILKDFSFRRTNLQANIDANIVQGLTVGTQISAKIENIHNVSIPALDDYFHTFLSIFNMWPIESMYANDNPDYINQTHNISTNPAIFSEDVSGWLDNIKRSANVNVYAQYNFPFGLSAKGVYSYNYENEDFDAHEYTFSSYKYNKETDTYETKAGWGVSNPWKERHKRNVMSRYMQFQLSYDKQFGSHNISAVAAYEQSDYDNTYFVIQSVPSNNYIELMSFSELSLMVDDWNYEARAGYIGRFNYNYKGKYLIELLGRYDGSYLYAEGKRWGFFPGASLGWRISEEPFFQTPRKWINDLKIRASIGQTGSEMGVRAHGYLSGYDFKKGGAMLDGTYVVGLQPRGLPVTNLTWVTNTSTNIGMDLSFFDSKLTTTMDIFQRKRTGLPAARYDVLLPEEVGYSLPNENLNSDKNQGMEGIITYANKTGDWNYSVSANATYSRFYYLNQYKPRFENSWDEYRNSQEHRVSGISWGYQVIGRFQSEDEINNYPVNIDGKGNRTLLPGDFIYKDVNGDGVINALDERPIGYPRGWAPFLSYGFNVVLGWKGVTLGIDFAGGAMQSYLRNYELKYPFQNDGNSPEYLFTDRWHREDPYDPGSKWIPGTYPAVRKGNEAHSNYWDNDFWLVNVRYLRLKNLKIGYEIPKKLTEKVSISRVNLYVNASNLFSLDNVREFGIDPEITQEAALVYPLAKTIVFGINVSF